MEAETSTLNQLPKRLFGRMWEIWTQLDLFIGADNNIT